VSKQFQIREGNLIASFDLENEDGDIDFCKLLKVSHGVADEIGMFVDYVVTNKIIKDQSKQIADLEAKLAESEEELLQKENKIEDLMLCEFVATTLDFNKLSADNCRLREQLAEKEKELNLTKKLLESYRLQCHEFLKTETNICNEDKISFAEEQLEKVKEFAKSIEEHIYNMYDNTKNTNLVSDYHYAKLTVISNLFKFIDNQIKQLKGEK
jgi:hypothetical protein